MFLLLWYSPPQVVEHVYMEYVPVNKPKIVYVFDDRKQRREDEEILFLKP